MEPRAHITRWKTWITVCGLCWWMANPSLHAQVERVNGFESRTFAVVKAKLVVAPDAELEQANLIVRDGLIVAAGKDAAIPPEAEIIDGTGLVVYSGFIDAGTSALLDPNKSPVPVGGRRNDFARYALASTPADNRKSLTPEFEAFQGLKSEPALVEARRKAGFTSLHVLPAGRIAGGQGTWLTTSSAPLRESILATPTFSEFHLTGPREAGYPATSMGATAHLRQAFLDARRHTQHQQLYARQAAGVGRPAEDPALQTLGELADKKTPAVFVANSRDEIHRALDFAQEQQLPAIVWGGRDAYRCIERLKQEAVGVIVQANWGDEPKIEKGKPADDLAERQKDPPRVQKDRQDRWHQRVAGLKTLAEQKIRFAFSSEGLNDPADLVKAVRQAIKEGLPRAAALAAFTRDAAALLGQDKRLGTLTPGKLAHVTILNGPFDDERSKVRFVFVDGVKFEYNKNAESVPAGGSGPQSPPVNLAGTWQIEIEAADDKVPATLELSQSGKALSGLFKSGQGDGKVTAGTLNGAKIDLVVAIGVGAQSLDLKFAGNVEESKPDQLAGTLKSAFGAVTKWTAQRKPSAEQPKRPEKNAVALSLDDKDSPPLSKGGQGGSGEPAHAAKPSTEATKTAAAKEFPTELESDRSQRHLRTGGNLFIKNGTVLTGKGEPLLETSVLIKQGKIAAIGRDVQPEEGMAVIDATGRFVIPGLIDTHSHIMIGNGLSGVNEATVSIVAEVRVKDVIRTDDVQEYRALAGGLTTARLLHGSANVIGGQDAVVKMKFGDLAKDQLITGNPQGVKFALGENVKFQQNRFPNTRLGVEATLNRAFMEALDYRRQWMEYRKIASAEKVSGTFSAKGGSASGEATAAEKVPDTFSALPPRRDLRLEALADIIEQQKFIHSHCYRADEILMLLRIADGLGIRVRSLQHVLEGYKVAPEIFAHGASCSTFSDWWAYKVEAYDAIPYNAALLAVAGVNVVLKSDDPELIRHMYAEAAKMLRYGNLPPDAALRMVTLNSARELGLDARLGSIEVGKDADLAIFSGHPLNLFSRCEQTIIDGEVYFVREKQPSAMSAAAAAASAQSRPLVLPPKEIREKRIDLTISPSRQYALVGATLHPVDAPDIERGTLLVHGDKITALGASVEIPPGTQIVDVAGLHVYPGLIDAGTILGLYEIGKVTETQDFNEVGQFQPDLRAAVAVNPDSELIPVARAGGITTALIRPTGGIVAGQCSLIKLDGWTVPEMALNFEAGLQVNWPQGRDTAPRIDQLREFFHQGQLYNKLRKAAEEAKSTGPIADPRFEALAPYVRGEKRVFIEANSRKEIAEALLFAEKESLKIVLTGGADAGKLADELKKRDIPVIVGPVMRKPEEDHDPFDAPYANPGRLHEAGVRFCIRSNHSANSRNAPFEAAMAVAYGLPEDEALKSVTLHAARILQVDDRLGSLAPGKSANLIITDGSPLQAATQYKAIFIHGKPHAPESRQTRLYEKYRGRLLEVQGQKS